MPSDACTTASWNSFSEILPARRSSDIDHTLVPERLSGLRGGLQPGCARIIAAGADQTVWVWETSTGRVNFKLSGSSATVPQDVAFAPDSKHLATVGDDGTFQSLRDITTGQQQATLAGNGRPLTTVAFSTDGQWIATGGSDEAKVTLWDGVSYALRQSLALGPAESLAFSPGDARLAIAGRDGCIRVCQLDERGSWAIAATIRGHADVVLDLAWSPDGTRLATASLDFTVKLWDANSQREIATFGPLKEAAYCVNFSPDGRRLAAAVRNEPLRVWNIDQPQTVTELLGHTALVTSATFSPDGWRLLSASEDGTVRLWDAARATDHDRLEGHFGPVRTVAFSPDGKILASGGAEDGAVILWDAPTCGALRVLRCGAGTVTDLAFSPDAKYLAFTTGSSAETGHLRIWDVAANRETLVLAFPSSPLLGVSWAPDGTRLAVRALDGTIRLVDANSGRDLATWSSPKGRQGSIAFSNDGSSLVSTGDDNAARVWHVATHALVHELQGHTAPVVNALFDPQGTLIASSSNDHTIRLWDAATGRHLRTLTGHNGTPYGLAFSADRTRLASSSTDQTVKLWDCATGLGTPVAHRPYQLGTRRCLQSRRAAIGFGRVRRHRPHLACPIHFSSPFRGGTLRFFPSSVPRGGASGGVGDRRSRRPGQASGGQPFRPANRSLPQLRPTKPLATPCAPPHSNRQTSSCFTGPT